MLVLRYDARAKVVIYKNSFGHEFKHEFVTDEGMNEYLETMINQFKIAGKKYVVKPLCPNNLEGQPSYKVEGNHV